MPSIPLHAPKSQITVSASPYRFLPVYRAHMRPIFLLGGARNVRLFKDIATHLCAGCFRL